jgi:microcystin-dependent protein
MDIKTIQNKITRLPYLRDIIGNIQIRKRSIGWDRMDWPIGATIPWQGAEADIPAGWVKSDGGTYNGFATLNLNDSCYLKGTNVEAQIGDTGGANTHTLTIPEMPAHTHDVYRTEVAQSGINRFIPGAGAADAYVTSSTGGGDPHNNEPKYIKIMWIVYVGD